MHSSSKTPRAVALSYQAVSNEQGSAPKLVAKGNGSVAEEIIALAQQHGIFIHQDEQLTEVLSYLDLGQDIPESMYHVIAELIAFSFVLQGKFPENWTNTHQKIDFKE